MKKNAMFCLSLAFQNKSLSCAVYSHLVGAVVVLNVDAACEASCISETGRCICLLDENKLCQYEPIWARGRPALQELLIVAFSYLQICPGFEFCLEANRRTCVCKGRGWGLGALWCKCCWLIRVTAVALDLSLYFASNIDLKKQLKET